MSMFIDEYTALFSQPQFMGAKVAIPDGYKSPVFLASTDPS